MTAPGNSDDTSPDHRPAAFKQAALQFFLSYFKSFDLLIHKLIVPNKICLVKRKMQDFLPIFADFRAVYGRIFKADAIYH